jgi:AcrR family transcriptional regulator
MPKRDEAYMDGQRDLIAQAALECMLEKGMYETSLRDICARAGVSMGALYIHFNTRDDLVVAACTLDPTRQFSAVTTWKEYEAAARSYVRRICTDDHLRRRTRLSLQFAADHALAPEDPPGAAELWEMARSYYRESLRALHKSGVITLPLGLETTASLHYRMESGTAYAMIADKRVDAAEAEATLVAGLALTAGFVGSVRKPRVRARSQS